MEEFIVEATQSSTHVMDFKTFYNHKKSRFARGRHHYLHHHFSNSLEGNQIMTNDTNVKGH